jgi:AP-2 complex subunit mu-1
MLTGVALIDRTGEILCLRKYRRDFDFAALDAYRIGVIAAKEVQSPCMLLEGVSFLHHLHNEVYYVAATRQNVQAGSIFQFLARIPEVVKSVLGLKEELTSTLIRHNAADIIELLDEMADTGYPQNTDPESLRLLTQRASGSAGTSVTQESQVTIMATGAISWRAPNIVYRRNELFVDVIEKVSVLVSAAGKLLDASVNGNIILKVYLSGMPECKIGFNDKVQVEAEGHGQKSIARAGSAIEVDDMVFHQCVKLTNFANDRAISFIPPDGEFELMRYRKTDNISIPFSISPMVHDLPGNNLEIRVTVRSTFDQKLSAGPLILSIPTPENTADVKVTTTIGRAKYVDTQNAVVWKITSFPGKSQADISLTVTCLAATTTKVSAATKLSLPISAEFTIPMFSASQLALRYLKIVERSGYTAEKWLRYITRNGKFEVRIV